MIKTAITDHPVQPLIAKRWSPYGFDSRPVPQSELRALFEAARWAASAYNEQPWRFIVATQDDDALYAKVLSCLWDLNQAWAKQAPVLVLCLASLNFALNNTENRTAFHDLGLATGNLSLEATARGIAVHPMSGIHPERVQQLFAVPEGFRALTALAIGYCADPETLIPELKQRDTTARTRKPLDQIVFGESWNKPSALTTK